MAEPNEAQIVREQVFFAADLSPLLSQFALGGRICTVHVGRFCKVMRSKFKPIREKCPINGNDLSCDWTIIGQSRSAEPIEIQKNNTTTGCKRTALLTIRSRFASQE